MKNNSQITLFQAFSILLNGPYEKVGAGYRWKKLFLTFALLGIFAYPCINDFQGRPYKGKLPPNVPLIRSVGNLVAGYVPNSFKREYVTYFKASDGQVYRLQDNTIISEVGPVANFDLNQEFYVEGFILENGRGLFWPTMISRMDGSVILSRERLMKELNSRREPFGTILVFEYCGLLPFWIVSLINAVKLKNKLSKENK